MYLKEIIVGIFTILGVITGGFIGYFFSLRLLRRQEFNKLAAKFRANFINELRLLDRQSVAEKMGTDAYKIIKPAIDKHEVAVIEFQPYLSEEERKGFELAWKEYCCFEEQTDMPFLEKYDDGGSLRKRADNIKLAKQRIEKLVSFARPK